MTFAEKSVDGVFTGTTAVDLVPVPASAHTSVVRKVGIFNADTVSHDFTLYYNNNATLRTLAVFVSVPPNGSVFYEVIEVLDATTKKLQGKIDATATTTAPSFVCSFGDVF
jgi:hypothetical protein